MGTKWAPRFLAVVSDVPVTATQKINKPSLRREAWLLNENVFHRPGREIAFEVLDDNALARLEALFEQNGRAHLLPLKPAETPIKETV